MKLFRSTLLAASSMTLAIAGATALTAPGALADDAAFEYGDIQTIVALQDRGDDRRGGRGARGGRGGGDDGARGGNRGGREGARGGNRGGRDGARGGNRGGRTDGPRRPDVRIPDETPGGDFRGARGGNRGGEGGNGGARGGNRGGGPGLRGGNRGGREGAWGGNRGGRDGYRDRNRGGRDGYRDGNRGNPRFDNRHRGGRDGYRGGNRGNPRFDNRHRGTPRFDRHRGGPRYNYRNHHRGRYVPPRRYRAYSGRYHRPARASWRYHTYYYNHGYDRYNWRYYDRACHANGESVIAGALLGALFGAAVADDDAAGALFGGFLGASVGYGLNDCDRGQYRYAVTYAFNNNSPYYWHNPYSGVRGVVYARDYYSYRGQRCRYGDAEIFMPDGSVEYDQVRMCQDRYGRWQVANYQ